MTNVLVYPAGTESSMEVFYSLSNGTEFSVIGADSEHKNPGTYVLGNCSILPEFTSPEFCKELEALCKEKMIDYVLFSHDGILPLITGRTFSSAEVVAPPASTVDIIKTKSTTYAYLSSVIKVPKTFSMSAAQAVIETSTLFVKPDAGRGSIGAVKVCNKEELSVACCHIEDPVVCEYLPGEEFTTDCASGRDGRLIGCCTRIRHRIKNGITAVGTVVEEPKLNEIAKKIGSALNLSGPWFFQTKCDADGVPTLLEINARVAGTMCLSRVAGFNAVLLSLYAFISRSNVTTGIVSTGITVFRHLAAEYHVPYAESLRCIIWDLDDTLCDGKAVSSCQIRPWCRYAIERLHRYGIAQWVVTCNCNGHDIVETLKLIGLPSSNVVVSKHGKKYSAVKKIIGASNYDKESVLFIDDSFVERESVREKVGIIVADSRVAEDLVVRGILVTLESRRS